VSSSTPSAKHRCLERAAAFGFSGSVLVARHDTVLVHGGYGFADRENGVPAPVMRGGSAAMVNAVWQSCAYVMQDVQARGSCAGRLFLVGAVRRTRDNPGREREVPMSSTQFVSLLLIVAVSACGSAPPGGSPESATGITRRGGAVILTGVALDEAPGDLLSAMIGKVPSLRVTRGAGCPQVTLRSTPSTELNVMDPQIYVNGTPAVDTCVLESLRAADVERVEVFASGVANRAGYLNDPNGLILVFMKTGERRL
jgi:hypothetical protein